MNFRMNYIKQTLKIIFLSAAVVEQNATAVPNVYGKFLIGCFVIGLSFKFSDLKHRLSQAKFSLLPEKLSVSFAM